MKDTTQGKPPFIMRRLSGAEFRSYVAGYDFGSIPPDRVVLHHTLVPTVAQWNGTATMLGMQRHYARLGWSSSPHLYVAQDGIWLAAPMYNVGIHAGTGNANGSFLAHWNKTGRQNFKLLQWYSIGLEMVGNYDKVRPSGAIWRDTLVALGALARRFGKTPEQLVGFHRDFTNQKSCPGWAVSKAWVCAELRAAMLRGDA